MTDIWGRRIFKTGEVVVVLLGFKFRRLAMLLLFASAAIAQSQTPAADVPAFTAQGAFVAINGRAEFFVPRQRWQPDSVLYAAPVVAAGRQEKAAT